MKKHLDITPYALYNAYQGLYLICLMLCVLYIFTFIWHVFIMSGFVLLCFEDNAKNTCVDEAISQYRGSIKNYCILSDISLENIKPKLCPLNDVHSQHCSIYIEGKY